MNEQAGLYAEFLKIDSPERANVSSGLTPAVNTVDNQPRCLLEKPADFFHGGMFLIVLTVFCQKCLPARSFVVAVTFYTAVNVIKNLPFFENRVILVIQDNVLSYCALKRFWGWF